MAIKKKDRLQVEELVYKVMNALDPSGSNTEHYMDIFNRMDDKTFEKVFTRKFPLKFHTKPFEIEPKIEDIEKAAKTLDIPILEKVRMPHLAVDAEGRPIRSQECLVGYIHLRKEQQLINKKNSMSTSIIERDMKTGLLVGYDKNGGTSDREAESLVVNGLDKTYEEFMGPRADSMHEKSTMYNQISNTGSVSQKDIPADKEGSIATNTLEMYLLGAGISSGILDNDNYLPYTLRNKKRNVGR